MKPSARRVASRAPLLALSVFIGACVAAAVALAAFTNATSNTGNTVTADTVQPATGLGSSTSCVQSGTISVVAANSGTGTSTVAITKPTGTTAGDVLVAGIQIRGGTSSTITPPSGWNLIRRDSDAAGTQITSAAYWKLAGSSEPASYTFSTSAPRMVGGIVTYRGVDGTTPVNVSGAASGTSNSAGAPSVTTTVANTELIALGAVRQATFSGTPTGMTQRWNLNSAGGANAVGGAGADLAVASAGATGTKSFSIPSSADWVAQSIALKPPASPRVSLSWTATSSTWATGYTLERWIGTTLDATFTVPGRTTTSYNDDTVTGGTAYTYKLYATYGSWQSSMASTNITAQSGC